MANLYRFTARVQERWTPSRTIKIRPIVWSAKRRIYSTVKIWAFSLIQIINLDLFFGRDDNGNARPHFQCTTILYTFGNGMSQDFKLLTPCGFQTIFISIKAIWCVGLAGNRHYLTTYIWTFKGFTDRWLKIGDLNFFLLDSEFWRSGHISN